MRAKTFFILADIAALYLESDPKTKIKYCRFQYRINFLHIQPDSPAAFFPPGMSTAGFG